MAVEFRIKSDDPSHLDDILDPILGGVRPQNTMGAMPATPAPNTSQPASLPMAPMPSLRTYGSLLSQAQPQQPTGPGLRPSLLGRIPQAIETGALDIGRGLRSAAPVLGKIGKTLGEGAALWAKPELASQIPGLRDFKEREEARTVGLEKTRAETDAEKARAEEERALAGKAARVEPILADVTARYSDALARGDTAEAERLAPLVKQYEQTTEKPSTRTATPDQQAIDLQRVIDDPASTPEQKKKAQADLASLQKGAAALKPVPAGSDTNQSIANYFKLKGYNPDPNSPDYAQHWQEAHQAYTQETKTGPGVARMEIVAAPRWAQIKLNKTALDLKIKQAFGELPTADIAQRGQFATELLPHFDTLEREISEADKRGLLGPIMGRGTEFMAGKVGTTGNPETDRFYARLRNDLNAMASGLNRTHFGGRAGIETLQYFNDSIGKAFRSKDALDGALDNWRDYLTTYASAVPEFGQGITIGGESLPPLVGQGPRGIAPAAGGGNAPGKVPTFSEWKAQQKTP